MNRSDFLHDLQEVVKQLDEASAYDTPTRSVTTISRDGGRQRKLSSRLTNEQVRELVATFEVGQATRIQLAEHYGIGRMSVAKLLREWRESQSRDDVA